MVGRIECDTVAVRPGLRMQDDSAPAHSVLNFGIRTWLHLGMQMILAGVALKSNMWELLVVLGVLNLS